MTQQIQNQIVQFLPRLRRFAYALTGGMEDGDELVQDTCVRALDKIHQWQEGTRLDSWMFRIAQNLWIDKKRSARERYESSEDIDTENLREFSIENPAEIHLELEQVRNYISELPLEQRIVVALVCVDGLSYKEASEVVEVPVGTVMSRLSRARKILFERMNRGC